VDIDDGGRLYIADARRGLLEFERDSGGWRPAPPLYGKFDLTGLRFDVMKSRINNRPDLHDTPAWNNIDPSELIELRPSLEDRQRRGMRGRQRSLAQALPVRHSLPPGPVAVVSAWPVAGAYDSLGHRALLQVGAAPCFSREESRTHAVMGFQAYAWTFGCSSAWMVDAGDEWKSEEITLPQRVQATCQPLLFQPGLCSHS
jgi:hypothetical protein